MLVNISMKFHEDILNGLKVIERTQFCHRHVQILDGICGWDVSTLLP